MDVLIPFPHEAQRYLREKYGIPPYSNRHVKLLVKQGRYPRPIEISPRRQANSQSQLDRYGLAFLEKINAELDQTGFSTDHKSLAATEPPHDAGHDRAVPHAALHAEREAHKKTLAT